MTRKEAQVIYVASQQMSNWLYNMSQHDSMKQHRAMMQDMVTKWDENKSALAKLTHPRKRAK